MALMSMEWSLLILIFHFSKAKLLALILSSEQEKDGALRTARKTTRARTLQKHSDHSRIHIQKSSNNIPLFVSFFVLAIVILITARPLRGKSCNSKYQHSFAYLSQ
jgi:hypothetical protein